MSSAELAQSGKGALLHPYPTPTPTPTPNVSYTTNKPAEDNSVVLCISFEMSPREMVCMKYISSRKHAYIQMGFTGVYNIFLISAQNIDRGYSLEPPRRGGSNEYQQSMF